MSDPARRIRAIYTARFWHRSIVSVSELAEAICDIRGIQGDVAVLAAEVRWITESHGDSVDIRTARRMLLDTQRLPDHETRHLGTRIAQARSAANLTVMELAADAGLNPNKLRNIEEIGHVSKPIALERLARALKTTPDALQSPPIEE